MTTRLQRLLGLVLLVGLAVLPTTAVGQDAGVPHGARDWIHTRHGAVNRLLATPATPERDLHVARILDGMLDLTELARQALTPYWEQRTAAERTEFVDLLRQLVDRNYQQNLDRTLNFNTTEDPESVDTVPNSVTVRTTARSRTDARAAPVQIDYRMHPHGTDWVVYDIITNGASLVQSYHDSYTRIIRDHGFPELLVRMRTRIARIGQTSDGGTAGP